MSGATECPPGSFGVNCSEECPEGFYGHFYEENCTCIDTFDKQYGCAETTSETVHNMFLVISVIAIAICFLAICSTTVYFARRSKKRRWSICTTAAQESQQDDYTEMLTNRTQPP